jgi:hypothetical protein
MLERKCVTKKTGTSAQPQLASSSWQRNCPHVLKTREFVTNNNMVFVTHPHYSPDLAPLFRFVSQIENETGGTFWNSAWHLTELQAVLDSIKENDFQGAFEAWGEKKKKGSLYTFPRKLFWRRWQPKLS